ncbi:MAG: hypothetical protein MUO87_00645 [Thermoplasmata archaeon]|nr:hypothetical protein [Thermoplasmata archaeon]
MMKRKILGILATLLMVIGVVATVWAFQPAIQSETETLPYGGEWIVYYEISGWINGHLSGDFVVAPGDGLITAHIMDLEAYEEYMLTGIVSDTLYSETGSTGSFSVDLPSTSTYYLTFEHSDRIIEQTFDVDMRVTGITMIAFVAGVAAIVIGVVMAVLSFRMKAREMQMTRSQSPQSSDVTMFDEEHKAP